MLKHLIIKEIANHIQKLRFLLTGIIVVLMFTVSSLAFISEYSRIVDDYKTPEQRAERYVNLENPMLAMIVQLTIYVQQKPNPLWFCINGGAHVLPGMFEVRQLWNREVRTSYYKSRENPWIQKLGALDWVFLTGFLLSFMAVVLGYDSFSGEKEEGTLRLMLSNNVPRYEILVGKFLGIFLTILFPLLIGQILSLIIVQSSPFITLMRVDWLRIGIIVTMSWLYIAVFILTAMLISSLTHRSSTSIIILLLIWVMLALIIPGSSGLVARIMYNLPRKEVVEQQANGVYNDAVKETQGKQYSIVEKARIHVNALHEMARIRDRYRQKKFAQVEVARSFARLSPTAAYEYAIEASSGVGISSHKNLLEQLKNYRTRVGDYIVSEERRVSDDPKGLVYYTTLPWKEFNIKALPIFQEKPISFARGLKDAILDAGLLVMYCILFFAGAYVSFNRYDVR